MLLSDFKSINMCLLLKDNIEVLEEFKQWKLSPQMDNSSLFMRRILDEDVRPCLKFHKTEVCKI